MSCVNVVVKNPKKLRGVWGRVSAPQAVSEGRLTNPPLFSILRLAQSVKVQGFNWESHGLHELLWLLENARIPKYSYLQALLNKTHATVLCT